MSKHEEVQRRQACQLAIVKWIQARRDDASTLFLNYGLNVDGFMEIGTQRSKRGASEWPDAKPLYKNRIPISSAKKNDLVSLCKSGIIPEEHHAYYMNLPSSQKSKDYVPTGNSDTEESDNE